MAYQEMTTQRMRHTMARLLRSYRQRCREYTTRTDLPQDLRDRRVAEYQGRIDGIRETLRLCFD